MSKQTVIASDLTGKLIAPAEQVSITVLESPYLDHPVKLDAAESELAGLDPITEYVVLEVTGQRGSHRLLIDTAEFVTLFKEDVGSTLARAERLEVPRQRRAGGRANAEQLAQVRTWLRDQGHEIAHKGRVPANLQALYDQAHARSA